MSQADEAKTDSEQQAVITLTAQLTRQPERVSALDLQPLAQAGWSHARVQRDTGYRAGQLEQPFVLCLR